MPTPWIDNPATSSTRIRAVHINELRDAVNCHYAAYGSSVTWTDNPVTSNVRIRAIHFTEIRNAIQTLWNQKTMGAIPSWTAGSAPSSTRSIRASDINNLRGWLNSYETNTTGGVYGPLRGLHLRNGGDMRPQDVVAANRLAPGMVVVLSSDVLQPTTLNYLKSLPGSVEVFCRRWPTSFPQATYTTFEGYNAWLKDSSGNLVYQTGGEASQENPDVVAQDIINKYDSFIAQGPAMEWLPIWISQVQRAGHHRGPSLHGEITTRFCVVSPTLVEQRSGHFPL